jgi:hypothetical protein
LKPEYPQWQEITCYVDRNWQGVIDQIGVYFLQNLRGDLWIGSIELLNGPPERPHPVPDLASTSVVPTISVPGVSQAGVTQAFQVLSRNLIVDVPAFGFSHPFTTPGGYYTSGGWWEMDTSLATAGAKWTSEAFAEGIMRGFHEVQAQNADGRIDVYSRSAIRGQVGDVSQIPDYFPMAYDIACRTEDPQIRLEIYDTMRKYVDWWLSPVKRDTHTGLVWGTFEEALGEKDPSSPEGNPSDLSTVPPETWAPVDLNVMVAVGARLTGELAASLGLPAEAQHYSGVFHELAVAINRYLWDDADGAYYNYDLRQHTIRRRLIVSTFFPLRMGIAPPERRARLLKRLVDPAQFNWGRVALTSLAKTDPDYVEATGHYEGHAWWGNVWTERNMTVIAGLDDSGRPDLATALNWATIREFQGKYREYLVPSTGEAEGAQGFTWTASQYVSAIIDHLFGVHYDAIRKRLTIAPHVPPELYGREISIEKLILPAGRDSRLMLHIRQISPTSAVVRLQLTGELPIGDLRIMLPGTDRQTQVPMRRSYTADFSNPLNKTRPLSPE